MPSPYHRSNAKIVGVPDIVANPGPPQHNSADEQRLYCFRQAVQGYAAPTGMNLLSLIVLMPDMSVTKASAGPFITKPSVSHLEECMRIPNNAK